MAARPKAPASATIHPLFDCKLLRTRFQQHAGIRLQFRAVVRVLRRPSSEAGWSMVQLVGRTLEDVQADGEITGHITLEPEFMYSDSTEQGIIMWRIRRSGPRSPTGQPSRCGSARGASSHPADWEKKTQEDVYRRAGRPVDPLPGGDPGEHQLSFLATSSGPTICRGPGMTSKAGRSSPFMSVKTINPIKWRYAV